MNRTEYIKLLWKRKMRQKSSCHGWPQPPEHWLNGNEHKAYEEILDCIEDSMLDRQKPLLPSVLEQDHLDKIIRRDLSMKGAISMIGNVQRHNKGLKQQLNTILKKYDQKLRNKYAKRIKAAENMKE